ncbi:hypothetical protein L1049_018713 [Liquidambar formosana]|uniref:Endoglucanase n=1 Tax=Liquidambar formosana TaxID=63359 RepID=A0AAP0RBC8_LIQFO
MGISVKASAATIAVVWLVVFEGLLVSVSASFDYKDALTKSIIFLEAQRSGKLPPNQRPSWRGDSGLQDGSLANVDLVGGYYDAGDNVKYGLPMAFTVTTLAWAAHSYHSELEATGELENVRAAIRWGTDYFLKACTRRNRLYVQVGDPVEDHHCWMRPENMQTPRTVLMIDENTPGTEIAAETAAAMAASSIIFRNLDHAYSRRLLNKAKLLFEFAKSHKGTYDGECPFYCSWSGYNDELLWAASWLYMATRKPMYMEYIQEESISASVDEFSWDLKYAGAQVLLSKRSACQIQPKGHMWEPTIRLNPPHGVRQEAEVLSEPMNGFIEGTIGCSLKINMDYLLGTNPEGRSYMVGFGKNPPTQAHHRGASVPLLSSDTVVPCAMTFVNWFKKNSPNPNELTGAIVGGPDRYDNFDDQRWDSSKTEPATYVNSLAIGTLAKLATQSV